MNKTRLEAFSDGVFAIIITILVLEIKVPELGAMATNEELWYILSDYGHILIGYFLSVAVVAMFWLSHHFLFHVSAKNIDRWVVQINTLFLAILALIPFSAGLIGTYPNLEVAGVIYGINLLAAALCNGLLFSYIQKSSTIENGDVSSRVKKQGSIRRWITYIGFGLGIIASIQGMYYISIVLYCIPIVFNNIPGALDFTEEFLGLNFD
ncbi:DUF1211 domain-containing protein [Candidatus Gracilibacteria bacterium]|nr:DUF1211 domain-containing protein [Candidatus Gracilibacteria bacterium]